MTVQTNLYTKMLSGDFKKVGEKKLLWEGKHISFDTFKIDIALLKYNVQNGRIAELELKSDIDASEDKAIYNQIKKAITDHSIDELTKLGRDIAISGLKDPLIINRDGIILDGNRRYTAINMLLLGEIKPHKPTDLIDINMVEAVILDADSDDNSVKKLEYSIQYNDYKRDYDPISRAFDFARTHKVRGWTIAQISEATGIKSAEIEKDIRSVELMRVFLQAIGKPNDISFAMNLKLDGPIKEIASSKESTKYYLSNQKTLVDLLMITEQLGSDRTRTVRSFVKGVDTNGETIQNSPRIKKQISEIAEKIGVKELVKSVTVAKTDSEKIALITKKDEIKSNIIEQDIHSLRGEFLLITKSSQNTKKIDEFLGFIKTLNFAELSEVDLKKLINIKEIIDKNE